jgi:ABC-type phosphate transport system substrate-binding protein
VLLKYTATSSLATAGTQLTSGSVGFVSTDGRPPAGLWPDDGDDETVASVPVAGGALVVVYNLPGSPALVSPPPLPLPRGEALS